MATEAFFNELLGVPQQRGGCMDAAEAIAREQIRETLASYNHSGDRGRLEELVECFTPDGVLEIAGEEPSNGRDAILKRLTGVIDDTAKAAAAPMVRHHLSSTRIQMESDGEARVWSYFFVITEVGPDHWGRYIDRFRRTDDAWLIAHRRVVTEGASPNARMGAQHR